MQMPAHVYLQILVSVFGDQRFLTCNAHPSFQPLETAWNNLLANFPLHNVFTFGKEVDSVILSSSMAGFRMVLLLMDAAITALTGDAHEPPWGEAFIFDSG